LAVEPVGSKIFGPGTGPDKIEILDPGPGLPDGLYLAALTENLVTPSQSVADIIN